MREIRDIPCIHAIFIPNVATLQVKVFKKDVDSSDFLYLLPQMHSR